MKTAVSIPDDMFAAADRLAKRSRRSRSQLYTDAVREYLDRHSPDEVTEAMNRALQPIGDEPARDKQFRLHEATRLLKSTDW